jgi:hypothetical protein
MLLDAWARCSDGSLPSCYLKMATKSVLTL